MARRKPTNPTRAVAQAVEPVRRGIPQKGRIFEHVGNIHEAASPDYLKPAPREISRRYAADASQFMDERGRLRMLSVARFVSEDNGIIKSAIREKGIYSIGDGWKPLFLGRNQEWGEMAADRLENHWEPVANLRGHPFSFRVTQYLESIAMDRDGDLATALINDDGYPRLQSIPSHRIGSRVGLLTGNKELRDGPYRGYIESHGVVFDEYGRAVALHVLGSSRGGDDDQYISTNAALLNYSPDWFDMGRGVTRLAHAIRSLALYRDIVEGEARGIRIAASIGLVEKNEDGQAPIPIEDDPAGLLGGAAPSAVTVGVSHEELELGAIHYFRANSGSGLDYKAPTRPSRESQAFIANDLVRPCLAGLGWPYEFAVDASSLGGTAQRLIMEKVARTVTDQQMALWPNWIRSIRFALAMFIEGGLLPFDPDWHKWDAQVPRKATVDAGRQSQADINELRAGLTTMSELYGARGHMWREKVKQRVLEIAEVKRQCAAVTDVEVKPEEVMGYDRITPGDDFSEDDARPNRKPEERE
jgi:hypothetical protein